MRYVKPQLNGYAAIAVIQSGGTQKNSMNAEHNPLLRSVPAYEADE